MKFIPLYVKNMASRALNDPKVISATGTWRDGRRKWVAKVEMTFTAGPFAGRREITVCLNDPDQAGRVVRSTFITGTGEVS